MRERRGRSYIRVRQKWKMKRGRIGEAGKIKAGTPACF